MSYLLHITLTAFCYGVMILRFCGSLENQGYLKHQQYKADIIKSHFKEHARRHVLKKSGQEVQNMQCKRKNKATASILIWLGSI